MDTIVKFWQRIYFNIFKFYKFTQINIFGMSVFWLLKNKYILNSYQKRGILNPDKKIKSALINPENSTIIRQANGTMCIVLGFIFIAITNLLSIIFSDWSFWILYRILILGSLFIPAIIINYYLLWNQDQYLMKFSEFEKESRTVKNKWGWLSFIFSIGVMLFLILSFIIVQ